jgi:phenylalanyl-tRNA synthetase alpha chain
MDIEPLKQAALAEFKAAADLAALDQAKGAWLGPHGKFTALMKQLGALPKEERPAAGKLINQAKTELEAAMSERRSELELKAALPKEATDFTLPGRRRPLGKLHPLTQVTEDIVRSFRKIGFAVADGPEVEDEYHCFDALNTPATIRRAICRTRFICGPRAAAAAHAYFVGANPRDGKAASARAHHRAGARLSAGQSRRHA